MELVSDLDLIVGLRKFAGPIPISIVVVYNYFARYKNLDTVHQCCGHKIAMSCC
jgi:hypothetical protein